MVNTHIEQMYRANNIKQDRVLKHNSTQYLKQALEQNFPTDSLGAAVKDFFNRYNLDVDFYPTISHDEENKYIVQRAYQAHDLWHVLLGANIDPIDEMIVLSFTAGQLNSTVAFNIAVAAYFNCLDNNSYWGRELIDLLQDAYALGKKCPSLLEKKPELDLTRSLFSWREELGLPLYGFRQVQEVRSLSQA